MFGMLSLANRTEMKTIMSNIMHTISLMHIAFIMMAGITLGAAAMVVVVRNIFHALLFLTLSFLGVAGIYFLLAADFLAVVQVLVYVGAIIILMMFALMLTHRVMSGKLRQAAGQWLVAVPVTGGVLAILGWFFVLHPWHYMLSPQTPTTGIIGEKLLTTYVLPFELASIVLLVAMIGAIVLAKEDKADDPA
jgi:NADH:ubiquinone oxidoreductase subunit 6 (subunit J)